MSAPIPHSHSKCWMCEYFLCMEQNMMSGVFCKWAGYEIAATCVVTTGDHASYRHNVQVLCAVMSEGIY